MGDFTKIDNLLDELLQNAPEYPAKDGEDVVCPCPGLYAIFIDSPDNLPLAFASYVAHSRANVIYIGSGSKNLHRRLVEEDLRHQRPSTFFRGLGAVLRFRPIPGSLIGKKNQNNYRFSKDGTAEIASWINAHLTIRWIPMGREDIDTYEPLQSERIT